MNKSYDVVVVGSGIAGLFTALQASQHASVALVTKAALQESNTRYAQGGIAVVKFADDDATLHIADTLAAGAGLCDAEAVKVLCNEGPARVDELIGLGVAFDRVNGAFHRGLEAAHSRARVLHAGGDATGARIESALADAIDHAGIDVFEHTFLRDIRVHDGAVNGLELMGPRGSLGVDTAVVVLATGGAGQMFSHTTNPMVATGDGAAAAFRAGAILCDLEFYQFHPTALAVGDSFLVSEAVRGEGAILRNADGEAFMARYDARSELAPRDVVARAIAQEMSRQGGSPVTLDASSLDRDFLRQRFPSIDTQLKTLGLDWAQIPVTPAAHYWMGGVRTDTWGRTSLPGLYAVGEVASTGIHGANRLASNSLLEGIVFGHRAALSIAQGQAWNASVDDHLPTRFEPTVSKTSATADASQMRTDLQQIMWHGVGLSRDADGLDIASKQLGQLTVGTIDDVTNRENANLVLLAEVMTTTARDRHESRGAHFRSDHPRTEPALQRHTLVASC